MPDFIRFKTILSTIVYLVLVVETTKAQPKSLDKYEPEELHQHFRNVSKQYEIIVGGKQTERQTQPLMHWQNPVRQQEQGALYVWKKNGRPQVLGSIFTYGSEGATFCRHEMISMADEGFSAMLDGVEVWAPTKPGVAWKPVPNSTSPSESTSRRLFQMRTIARGFSGVMKDSVRSDALLKLIPQPLYRYAAPKEDVLDGAIFSLAVATDPEIFLLIEAFEENGTKQFRYGAIRSHYNQLIMKHRDEVVWEASALHELMHTNPGDKPWMSNPYFTFYEAQALPAPETLR